MWKAVVGSELEDAKDGAEANGRVVVQQWRVVSGVQRN